MPIYSYRCPGCGRDEDHFARVSERDANAPACCGQTMARQLTAPMVQVPGGLDVRYVCPMSGETVTSMKRRKYLMEANGVVDSRDLKDQWQKSEAKRKAEKAEAAAYYDSLPTQVKEAAAKMADTPA